VGGESLTAASLVDVLLALIRDFAPDAVHTLDFDGVDGDGDHSDHYAVAAFAAEAQARYSTPHSFVGFEGYGIAGLPENVVGSVLDQKRAAFLAYGQYDFLSCGVLSACDRRPEGAWLSKEYTVAGSTPRPFPAPKPGGTTHYDPSGGS
jgi:LmbE family N-acetylglucosaminyl deacetylase